MDENRTRLEQPQQDAPKKRSLWPLFFFRLGWYLFAFLWLLLLILLVVWMIVRFYRLVPLAGWLQIPYFLWLLFAGYLNLGIYWLNP